LPSNIQAAIFPDVAAASESGTLQLLITTQASELYHALRSSNGAWSGFNLVGGASTWPGGLAAASSDSDLGPAPTAKPHASSPSTTTLARTGGGTPVPFRLGLLAFVLLAVGGGLLVRTRP
jgi:hypothetical protein